MGGDSCSEGRGFESRHCILDGHHIFSHIFVVRIEIVCLKKTKINEKEAEFGPFKKIQLFNLYQNRHCFHFCFKFFSFFNIGHYRPLFLNFPLFNIVGSKQMFKIKFSSVCNRIKDLWYQKRPNHSHCPRHSLVKTFTK